MRRHISKLGLPAPWQILQGQLEGAGCWEKERKTQNVLCSHHILIWQDQPGWVSDLHFGSWLENANPSIIIFKWLELYVIQCVMCVFPAEREMDEEDPGRQLDSESHCDLLCSGWWEMFSLLQVSISLDPGSLRKLFFLGWNSSRLISATWGFFKRRG